jgi:murein endopeptidase
MEKATSTHFRRCHVCGSINCSDTDKVHHCDRCGKSLAPFYYFDDRYTGIYSDHNLRPEPTQFEVTPIYGLTAYWEPDAL